MLQLKVGEFNGTWVVSCGSAVLGMAHHGLIRHDMALLDNEEMFAVVVGLLLGIIESGA